MLELGIRNCIDGTHSDLGNWCVEVDDAVDTQSTGHGDPVDGRIGKFDDGERQMARRDPRTHRQRILQCVDVTDVALQGEREPGIRGERARCQLVRFW